MTNKWSFPQTRVPALYGPVSSPTDALAVPPSCLGPTQSGKKRHRWSQPKKNASTASAVSDKGSQRVRTQRAGEVKVYTSERTGPVKVRQPVASSSMRTE